MTGHQHRLDELKKLATIVQKMDDDTSFHALKEVIEAITTRIEEVEKDKATNNPMWPKESNPYG